MFCFKGFFASNVYYYKVYSDTSIPFKAITTLQLLLVYTFLRVKIFTLWVLGINYIMKCFENIERKNFRLLHIIKKKKNPRIHFEPNLI